MKSRLGCPLGDAELPESRCLATWALAVLGWASLAAAAPPADDVPILQQAHAWGRFGKGSWRQVRIVTENFGEDGKLANSSTTDNKTTLIDATPDRVTLKVEVTVEIAGQRIPSPPQIIKQGYAGESAGQTVSIKPLRPELLLVDGRRVRCETQQIEITSGVDKEVTLISYAPRMTPPILKRKTTMSDAASGMTTQEIVTEAYALDKRIKVLDEPTERSAYRVRQVLKSDRGSTTTWSVHVYEIPGEVVTHSSNKLDPQGKLVRRSTLELVGYGVEEDDAPDPAHGRKRRHKRSR